MNVLTPNMDTIKILWVDDEIDLLKPHILFLEKIMKQDLLPKWLKLELMILIMTLLLLAKHKIKGIIQWQKRKFKENLF